MGVLFLAVSYQSRLASKPPPLASDFSGEPVKIDRLNFDGKGLLPTRIIIPSLKIDLKVKLSPVKNGYWVVWEDKAGFGEGGAPPGENGNTVIFAHAREGLFARLKDVKVKERIYVLTDGKSFSYEVTEIKTILPNEVDVIAPTLDQTLTLYTCSGFMDKKRLIVIAKPIGDQ